MLSFKLHGGDTASHAHFLLPEARKTTQPITEKKSLKFLA
jgi:hypothetical protein